jgi:hypothetical protein
MSTDARVANVYVEVVYDPYLPMRVANLYVEVVFIPAVGGWAVGVVRMGPN